MLLPCMQQIGGLLTKYLNARRALAFTHLAVEKGWCGQEVQEVNTLSNLFSRAINDVDRGRSYMIQCCKNAISDSIRAAVGAQSLKKEDLKRELDRLVDTKCDKIFSGTSREVSEQCGDSYTLALSPFAATFASELGAAAQVLANVCMQILEEHVIVTSFKLCVTFYGQAIT
jgi:hypothetical protein